MTVIPASGLNWGFTAGDLLSNGVALYSSVATFILLAMAIPLASRLVRFIKGILGSGRRG